MAFDPSGDFASVVDGLEAVTLKRRGSLDTVAITTALRRAVGKREAAASDGHYTTSDTRWHISRDECETAPALGDTLIDGDSRYWTVLEVMDTTWSSRWACVCRDVAVANRLDTTVVVERATLSKDTEGGAAMTWTTHQVVRARIQEIVDDLGEDAGAQTTGRRYRVYVTPDVELTHRDRIKDLEGNYYRIVSVSGMEDIGGVQTIDAEAW